MRNIVYTGSNMIDIPDFGMQFFNGIPATIFDDAIADKLLNMTGFKIVELKNKKVEE